MYAAVRDALFLLPPEASHRVALHGLAFAERAGLTRRFVDGVYHPVNTMGLKFRNRVGLAAGLDKDARGVAGLMALGFGFVEVGTVTPLPQPGNPKPRLFRLPGQRALVNRMGFNNEGAEAMYRRLSEARERLPLAGLVGVNVGKNKDTPLDRAADDYVACVGRLHPVADYITVNVSSPNTPGLRGLQEADSLRALLMRVKEKSLDLTAASGRRVPVLAKVAPDLDAAALDGIAAVLCEVGIDGVIATNTTVTRPFPPESQPAHAAEAGGLSGPPLFPLALGAVTALARALEGKVPIVAVGGIEGLVQARAMIAAGATLVQIYTGFIYEGPDLVHKLACGLG